jgi:hypothetical protein
MSTEQQLRNALSQADGYEPSPDLWARVEGSIEEDRRHRRLVAKMIAGIVVAVTLLGGVAAASLVDRETERFVDWRVLEAVETVMLLALVVTLGPALRRFGRTFTVDVFRAHPATATAFLRLLDIAFYLVACGYVLATSGFDRPGSLDVDVLAEQLSGSAERIGGLLVVLGVLHVLTLFVLPVMGIAFTSGWRRGDTEPASHDVARPIPTAVLVAAVVLIAALLLGVALLVFGLGAS